MQKYILMIICAIKFAKKISCGGNIKIFFQFLKKNLIARKNIIVSRDKLFFWLPQNEY